MIAICFAKKPSFNWLNDRTSETGIPLLQVNFPDGNQKDYIHFKRYIPIPKQPHERDEDVDPCIFEGYLENEPEAFAVLTGGCPFHSSFEVIISSETVTSFSFTVKKITISQCPNCTDLSARDRIESSVKNLERCKKS